VQAPRPKPGSVSVDDSPTILVVGIDPIVDQLEPLLAEKGIELEFTSVDEAAGAAIAAAPDLTLVVGESSEDRVRQVLQNLSDDAASAVVPVVVLSPGKIIERPRAFKYGLVGTLGRELGAERLVEQITGILEELPELPGESTGKVQEATLDELVGFLSKELRSGVLSIKGKDQEGEERGARIVLRSGHSIGESTDD